MKILNKQQFLEQPEGIFYAEQAGNSIYFPELHIKGDTIYSNGKAIDWYYCDLINWDSDNSSNWVDNYQKMIKGESVKMNDCYGRNGLYEEGNFLVFEKVDLLLLKSFIEEVL